MAEDNLLRYKGYFGKVTFDAEADIFHGEVVNLRDVITFQGTSVEELHRAFIDSVDDYLDFCAERGEKPEKTYSGKFVLRIDPELHKRLSIEAERANTSLNQLVQNALEDCFA